VVTTLFISIESTAYILHDKIEMDNLIQVVTYSDALPPTHSLLFSLSDHNLTSLRVSRFMTAFMT